MDLEFIKIGNGIKNIGVAAFSNCRGLTCITIPDSVISIGDWAFVGCKDLTRVTIGNNIASIGSFAFEGCKSLANIYISSLESWCNIDGLGYLMNNYAFEPDLQSTKDKRLYLNGTEITELIIPDGVTNIKSYAFSYCRNITSITVSNSVTNIGDCAFNGCDKLKYNEYDNAFYLGHGNNPYHVLVKVKNKNIISYTFNEKTKVIIDGAFSVCENLTSITIGNSVTSIGSYAFEGCDKLTNIHISSIESWCKITGIDNLMRYGTSNKKLYINGEEITELIIPDSVTSIGKEAFYNCPGLTSITIPDSVTSIGDSAFV